MSDPNSKLGKRDGKFERKVFFSKCALVFEKFWPRFWILVAVGGAFVLLSLFEVWPRLDELTHKIALGSFALAGALALLNAMRISWPSREAAIRRIEGQSKVPHRPASSYEDTLSAPSSSQETDVIWRAHQKRMAQMMDRLRVGPPQPKTYAVDPMALRVAGMVGILMLSALAGRALPDQIAAAFDYESKAPASTARLDAWIAPPSYTRQTSIMLTERRVFDKPPQKQSVEETDAGGAAKVLEVPANSLLVARASGTDHHALKVDILTDRPEPRTLVPEHDGKNDSSTNATSASRADTVSEIRHKLTKSGRMTISRGETVLAQWSFVIIPDALPKIALTKEPERTRRGSMKLAYKVEDDYGVASARVKLRRLPSTDAASGQASRAQSDNKAAGPRPPLERPPELSLVIPRIGTKLAEAKTSLELGAHPWAGIPVLMTLEVKDVGGQVGQSTPLKFVLPERQFNSPFARAVIEQRRKLVLDPRNSEAVSKAISALTIAPETFIKDPQVYLGLRTARYRLERDATRAGRNSVINQLWEIALRIEGGELSNAERRLKLAQERLDKLLKGDATDEEIKQAMQELREALDEFMREKQKQAQKDGEKQDGRNENQQQLSKQDLDKMMKEIEKAAKDGSRKKAEQMLSELRDLLDQMQSNKTAQKQNELNKNREKQLNELSKMIGKQKELMDQTFEEQRKQQTGESGQEGKSGETQNQQGQQQPGSQSGAAPGQSSQRWGGQQRQQRGQGQGQSQQSQQQGGVPQSREGLGQRQQALRDELNKMQDALDNLGMGDSKRLNKADQAMDRARKALDENRLGNAVEEQGRALQQMRDSAQQMAQDMMENGPQQYGQKPRGDRDPLGRPQASRGPTQGNSVKVPTEIERQRAREILEELRRRVGEAQRPAIELDYIERLLERF